MSKSLSLAFENELQDPDIIKRRVDLRLSQVLSRLEEELFRFVEVDCKVFISESSKRKITFLGQSCGQDLLGEIGIEQIFEMDLVLVKKFLLYELKVKLQIVSDLKDLVRFED